MNKVLLSIVVVFLCGFTYAQDQWTLKDSVNGPSRGSCVSFVVEGECFLGMGRTFTKDKRSLYSYDPFQDDWDREPDLGGTTGEGLERSSSVAFTVDRKAYVGTGKGIAPFLKDIWEFDPETRTWSQKANFAGAGRRQAVAFAIDSFGYVGTGETDTSLSKQFWKYNPWLNDWTRIADFGGVGRKLAVAFSASGRGYVGTGTDGAPLNDLWEYDPAVDSWSRKKDFPGTPRYGATAFSIRRKGYIATGYDNTLSYNNDVWEYDTHENNWYQKENIVGPARAFATSFVIRGIAYLGTGFNGDYLRDFYANDAIMANPSQNNEDISVYPTIMIDDLNIVTPTSGYIINIYSSTGSLIYHQSLGSISNRLSLSHLMGGTYVYSILKDQSLVKTGKIIKG